MNSAEAAYLFRHALLRDVAYQLQPPAGRAELHYLVADILECDVQSRPELSPMIAEHLRLARAIEDRPGAHNRELQHTRRAATDAQKAYHNHESLRHWLRVAELADAAESVKATCEAAEVATLTGAVADALSMLEPLAKATTTPAPEVLNLMGRLCATSGTLKDADAWYMRAEEALAESPDKDFAASVRANRAAVQRLLGNVTESIRLSESAMEMSDAASARSLALGNIALLRGMQGELDLAFDTWTRLAEEYRTSGDKVREAGCYLNLGALFYRASRIDDAERWAQQALALARETGDLDRQGAALGNLAMVENARRNAERAIALYEESIAIRREVGATRAEALVLYNLGIQYSQLGRYDEARQCYQRSLRLQRETGDRPGEGFTLASLANVETAVGHNEKAIELLERALKIFRECSDSSSEGYVLGSLGGLLRLAGKHSEAMTLLRQALDLDRATNNPAFEASHHAMLALVMLETGEREPAQREWDEAKRLYTKVKDAVGLAQAAQELEELASSLSQPPLT
ncbi:MAG: tetratricopeptide repeat protein [Planctomycetes bacterium]|nr:tetratricopeptide repeat protein [Planctomycetota bacterium]